MSASPFSSIKAALIAQTIALGATGAAVAATPAANEQAEISTLQTAGVSPVAAIRTAEANVGGKALNFGYERDSKTNAYEVTVASASGLNMVQIDPLHGSVLNSTSRPSDAMATDGLPAANLGQAEAAPTSLASAVIAAEQAGAGRALEAHYLANRGHLRIDVDVVHDGKIIGYNVDPTSGRVTLASVGENQSRETVGYPRDKAAQNAH